MRRVVVVSPCVTASPSRVMVTEKFDSSKDFFTTPYAAAKSGMIATMLPVIASQRPITARTTNPASTARTNASVTRVPVDSSPESSTVWAGMRRIRPSSSARARTVYGRSTSVRVPPMSPITPAAVGSIRAMRRLPRFAPGAEAALARPRPPAGPSARPTAPPGWLPGPLPGTPLPAPVSPGWPALSGSVPAGP